MTPDGHRLRKHRLRAQHLARFPQLQPVIQRSDLEPAVYEGARGLPRAERTVDPPLQADSSSGSAASTSSIGLQHESLWQGCVCWSWGPSRTSMLARATSHPSQLRTRLARPVVPHKGRLGGLCRLRTAPHRALWRLSDRVAHTERGGARSAHHPQRTAQRPRRTLALSLHRRRLVATVGARECARVWCMFVL